MKRYLFGAVAAVALTFGGGSLALAKNLNVCWEGSPENLSPHLSESGTTLNALNFVFGRLVEFTPGTTKLEPGLAESWDVSDDGKSFTFHLRKGVKFQSNKVFTPTREFNADDVLATFNRMWKEEDPYHKVSGGQYEYFGDMGMPDLLKSIEKIDDYTVKFTLNDADATFLADLGMDFAGIDSKEYMDAMMKAGTPEVVDTMPIGTGPYAFVEYQKDAVIRYKGHEGYWGGKPPFDTVNAVISTESSVRKSKLEAGECDIMAFPSAPDVEALKKNPNVEVIQQSGLNALYLYMNVTKAPYDNVKVRHAINMAIDKKAIVKNIYLGQGIPSKLPIPPTMQAYDDSIKDYPYDPAAAKKLLEEAGVKEGTEVDLWAQPVQRPYNPDGKKMAELMQADLAKVGLKAKIVTYEWGEYRKRVRAGEHGMAQLGWTGDNGTEDNFLNVLFSCRSAREGGNNYSKWCDAEFSKLLDQAKYTADPKKRNVIYAKALRIFHEQAPVVDIAHSVVSWPVSKKVKNFHADPLGHVILRGVDKAE